MTSKQWRERLAYVAMSAFLAWHTLAIVVAPAPDNSVAVQSLRAVLQPYLSLFRLDNKWDSYAPEVGKGHQFRYVIEDGTGTNHVFVPTDELNWYHPNHWWFRAWYDAIVASPETYGDSAAAWFCQKHASLSPISITLLELEELDFSPANHLSGKNPLEPPFVTVNPLQRIQCPGQ
jgi:hypothetical protein